MLDLQATTHRHASRRGKCHYRSLYSRRQRFQNSQNSIVACACACPRAWRAVCPRTLAEGPLPAHALACACARPRARRARCPRALAGGPQRTLSIYLSILYLFMAETPRPAPERPRHATGRDRGALCPWTSAATSRHARTRRTQHRQCIRGMRRPNGLSRFACYRLMYWHLRMKHVARASPATHIISRLRGLPPRADRPTITAHRVCSTGYTP